jgi:hypothetical protein
VGPYKVRIESDKISVCGSLGWAKQKQMTPLRLIILRVAMLSFGRFFPNLVRSLLQKLLITGIELAPFHFCRQLCWHDGKWHIIDELQAESWKSVVTAGISGDQTSIHVVMSRTFRLDSYNPGLDLTQTVLKLGQGIVKAGAYAVNV